MIAVAGKHTPGKIYIPRNHSHEPLPVSSGVISPHTSLVSATAASQLRSMGDHSHEPLPANPGAISPPRADMASDPAFLPTTSRLHSAPTSHPRSAPNSASLSTTLAPLPPLGSALSSVLLASPSPSTSAPGDARTSASQTTLQRPPSSPTLASPLSPGLRS